MSLIQGSDLHTHLTRFVDGFYVSPLSLHWRVLVSRDAGR